jgi:hypothetical protein
MFLANQDVRPQGHTSHGRTDFDFAGTNGDHYIIELNLYREEKKSNDPFVPPDTPEDVACLRDSMAPLAKKAMEQINPKYVQSFKGGGRIINVAQVVARRTIVHAEFEVHGG